MKVSKKAVPSNKIQYLGKYQVCVSCEHRKHIKTFITPDGNSHVSCHACSGRNSDGTDITHSLEKGGGNDQS